MILYLSTALQVQFITIYYTPKHQQQVYAGMPGPALSMAQRIADTVLKDTVNHGWKGKKLEIDQRSFLELVQPVAVGHTSNNNLPRPM